MNVIAEGYKRFRGQMFALAAVAALTISGCVTDPVTGDKKLSFMSREQEIQLGQEGDQQIQAEFGVYDDAAIQARVDKIGKQVAAVSDDPSYPYTFHVLNTPVVNAFALPGGPVYVTRGLLAYIQNDAQLAMVLGHEVGHVNAHHAARQYTNQQLLGLGIGLGSILFEDVRPFLGTLQTGVQLLLLANSRSDESEADELGVRYATKAGYKASEGADFFLTLKRIQDMSQGGSLPTWLSTHPDPGSREVTVRQRAAELAQTATTTLGGDDDSQYLPILQNLIYGENPREGFVSGSTFYYPGPEGQAQTSFQFPVPSGWVVSNFATQVQLSPNTESPDAAIVLVPGGNQTPSAAANAFSSQQGVTVVESGATTVNGYSAYRLVSNITSQDANGNTSVITALSYFIQKNGALYIFHGYSTQAQFNTYRATFEGVATGFRQVTDAGVLAIKPFRLRVFQAATSAAFASLVQPNGNAKVSVEELAIINQRQTSEQIPSGTWLKEVVGP